MECTFESDIAGENRKPGFDAAQRLSPNETEAVFRAAQELHKQRIADHDEAVQAVNNTLGANVNHGVPDTSTGMDAMKKQAARSFIDPELARPQISRDMYDRAMGIASNSTVGQRSRFLDFVTFLSSNVTNKMAPVEKMFLKLAGVEGANSGAHPYVADLRNLGPSTAGTMNYYRSFLKPYEDAVKPFAKRWGMSQEEAAKRIATYALYEHFPERQEYLINERYPQMIAEVDALMQTVNPDTVQYKMLEKTRKHLNDARNEIIDYDNNPVPYHEKGHRRALSSGMTTAEARAAQQDFLQKYNVTHEEIAPLTQLLRDAYHKTLQDAVDKGLVTRGTLESFPSAFNLFVPVKTIRANASGLFNQHEGYAYNIGKYHEIEGMRETDIADAYSSIIRYMQRVATQNATRPVGLDLIALHNKIDMGKDWDNQLIHVYDLKKDLEPKLVTTGTTQDAKNRRDSALYILTAGDGFALGVDVPDPSRPGEVTTKIITFNSHYHDDKLNIDGSVLNQSMNLLEKEGGFLSFIGSANAKYTSMFTHWNPMFAPINAVKDGIERITAMSGQSYELEDGKIVDGTRFIPSYAAMVPKAAETLGAIMAGTATPDSSPMLKYWTEYVQGGLKQDFTPGRDNNALAMRKALEPPKPDTSVISKLRNTTLGQYFFGLSDATIGKLDKLFSTSNDYFNNVTSFAQYAALRESGVARSSALAGTMELMNLRESGKFTSALRALAPFAKPTIQGAKNFFRTIGLAPNARGEFRPNPRGFAMIAGQLIAMGMVMSMARASLGEDEEGRSNFDMLPITDLIRGIPFRLSEDSNDTWKLPNGFGWSQTAAGLYLVADRLGRNLIRPEEAAFTIGTTVLRNIQPADLPAFAANEKPAQWLTTILTPPVMRPLVETAANVNSFGGRLTYADDNSTTPMALQGRLSTPSIYHKMVVAIQRATGIDVAPEQLRNILEGYTGGIFRIIPAMMHESSLYAHGIDQTNAEILGPWLTMLGAASVHGAYGNNNLKQYYTEWGRVKRDIKNAGIDITNKAAYGNNPEKRQAYQRQLLEEAGIDSETIDHFFVLEAASKEVETLSKNLKKNILEGNWFDQTDDDDIKALFEQYATDRDTIMRNALQAAGYIV